MMSYRPLHFHRMADVCRLLDIPQWKLHGWIKCGLVPAPSHQVGTFKAKMYSTEDLNLVQQHVTSLRK